MRATLTPPTSRFQRAGHVRGGDGVRGGDAVGLFDAAGAWVRGLLLVLLVVVAPAAAVCGVMASRGERPERLGEPCVLLMLTVAMLLCALAQGDQVVGAWMSGRRRRWGVVLGRAVVFLAFLACAACFYAALGVRTEAL